MQLSKVISTKIESIGNLARRLIKVTRYGNNDTQEPWQANNYGIDSNPIAGMVAVYSDTTENGKNVIVGYLLKNQLANPGETRVFATDTDGNLKSYIWLDNDGIRLNGDQDNAVRFSKLESGLNAMVDLINENLPLIAAGIATGGGSYSPITINLNISDAKITDVKTS